MTTTSEIAAPETIKTVLLGVTGCIGAYKACEILRGLQKRGVRVKVVMTEHATHFVDPLTFRSLTHEKVAVDLFDDPTDPIHHISLADEADLFLIAPCTANVMAKLAAGIGDDLLTTTALAVTAPVVLAPAANVHMYENPITQRNMNALHDFGFKFVEAGEGYLACGYQGRGRMADPELIVDYVMEQLEGASTAKGQDLNGTPAVLGQDEDGALSASVRDLEGKKVMVTAGPTVEPIDPVRYISNHSSGKFGYAIAAAAAERGAEVTLVSGPVSLDAPAGVNVVRVTTACEMLEAAGKAFADADLAIFAAAVADVRPANPFNRKMKKGTDDAALAAIELVENPDILKTLATAKDQQFVVGFAAETDHVVENATKKLKRKNANLIVANQVGGGRAFGQNDNEIMFVEAGGASEPVSGTKAQLAQVLLDRVAPQL
ncbi:MAG: bifunctional phosphopantothenoylcysteine decarboxylase/phosphopantothenate--cysteine ligase CoaBC [Coriobacteriia bacterium]|nr:bifunctional phosphopantothenoylcysteine decarboxylase/phosphopantothenate--cysteine ligase CoaBC [Coriobacteriia bacterium]